MPLQKTVVDLKRGTVSLVDLTPAEVSQVEAARAAHARIEPALSIQRLESENPITQRHLRELTLLLAGQAGQVTPAMLDPTQPLDEESPGWLAISVGVRRCVLQERAIRVERAKL